MDMKNLSIGFSNKTYIVGLIVGVIVYLVGAELFLRICVIPEDRFSQVAVSVYDSEKRDVLIGDSQFEYGFPENYSVFEKLSFKGMPVETMEIILKEYYRHRKPDKIIIIANSQMLANNRVERGDWGFKEFFKLNTIDLPFMIYAFESLVSRNLSDIPKWLHLKPSQEYKDNMWEETEEDTRIEITRSRIEIQRPVKNFQETKNFKSYYKILTLLKEKNAVVCLLRMPVSVEYQELIRNDNDFLASEEAFKKMARLFEVKYVDFRQIPLPYNASFFINSDHLNEKGRRLFAPLAEKYCFDK
jgi:hypothetical protein